MIALASSTPALAAASAPASTVASPSAKAAADGLRQAAQGFEAIFLREMLAAARKADFGGDDLFGSQALDTFREMQDETFARIASETGAIGLARHLEAAFAHLVPPAAPAAEET